MHVYYNTRINFADVTGTVLTQISRQLTAHMAAFVVTFPYGFCIFSFCTQPAVRASKHKQIKWIGVTLENDPILKRPST